jgi:hypothetical protein
VIRYQYLSQLHPPAPFVYLTVRNPADGTEQRDLAAQLDSAADRTLVPEALVESLDLPRIGTILIGGVGGVTHSMPSYLIEVKIHDLAPIPVEVVANPGESWVLLGRDVLNRYRIVLDGPQLTFEIG